MEHNHGPLENELEEEEKLDALDPLRHLREEFEDDDDHPISVSEQNSANLSASAGTAGVIPKQPRTARGEQFLQFEDVSVTLAVDAGPGCGGLAWPAGEVLSDYLVYRGTAKMCGKTVLELGSGTGLVGLVAARLGARVCITDQAPLIETMKHNVGLNGLTDSVTVEEYNWGEPQPTSIQKQKPDVILAADCVYFEPAFPLLVHTLCDLVIDPSTEVLFCYKKRRKADKRFFTLLKKHFNWTEVDDDPKRDIWSREAISLLRLHRRFPQ